MDFFFSGIQFYILSNPYLCFISFFYLDLYVLGDDDDDDDDDDDALIS